jgi:hypothetical protein
VLEVVEVRLGELSQMKVLQEAQVVVVLAVADKLRATEMA